MPGTDIFSCCMAFPMALWLWCKADKKSRFIARLLLLASLDAGDEDCNTAKFSDKDPSGDYSGDPPEYTADSDTVACPLPTVHVIASNSTASSCKKHQYVLETCHLSC